MLCKETKIKRVYAQTNVSDLTLTEIERVITQEGINYAADYGFKVTRTVELIHSLN